MSEIVVAKRYAKALFEIAVEKNAVEQYKQELQLVVDTLSDNPDLQNILQHPSVDAERKLEVVQTIFKDSLSEIVMQTLKLLISRRRQGILRALLLDYVQIANDRLGQVDAVVYTPLALTDSQEQEIQNQFSKFTGKTVRVQSVIEPSLIGGIQVRIGNRVYDSSISGKLERLRKTFKSQAL